MGAAGLRAEPVARARLPDEAAGDDEGGQAEGEVDDHPRALGAAAQLAEAVHLANLLPKALLRSLNAHLRILQVFGGVPDLAVSLVAVEDVDLAIGLGNADGAGVKASLRLPIAIETMFFISRAQLAVVWISRSIWSRYRAKTASSVEFFTSAAAL